MTFVSVSRPFLPGRRRPPVESRAEHLFRISAWLWDDAHPGATRFERDRKRTQIARDLGLTPR